ncbi:MAG TPA: helix-turn-helix transcriptional regulator [Candidatus Aquicultor sp.]|jgi:DNA-binding CsgD family transcriptional regulator
MKQDKLFATQTNLLVMRWVALLGAFIDAFFKPHDITLFLATSAVLYSGIQTMLWRGIFENTFRVMAFLIIDTTIAGIFLLLSGGGWTSPFILFALTSFIIAAFSVSMRANIVLSVYFCVLFSAGLFFNRSSSPAISVKNLDMMLLAYSIVFMIPFGIGYLVSYIKRTNYVDVSGIESESPQATELIVRNAPSQIQAIVQNDSRSLSGREVDILRSLSTGKTNRQIAEELYITEKTVKNHLYRIFKKLGVSSRDQAILAFFNSSSLTKTSPQSRNSE